ncbi:hypothetical protein [Photorhabdus heterorhabditis]|uniref:hypothetical protein n=1 Tax=Photorhabdus heterorhabditis TaxID=880156 RepID=UPI0013791F13|nr:hypothetical protein [Photorhabdus heterorhabditis]
MKDNRYNRGCIRKDLYQGNLNDPFTLSVVIQHDDNPSGNGAPEITILATV